ncbi:hypothetical protein SADUNF_Sadunf05G0081700 [Salix dunnii]|uniref:Senescence domain-containing protein n=1 Tax=Salix dunnii TaxID=1413687 RepID=A0A835K497_9ROSI|nr:hypothetical protein SADUNF_Sadunf05G0081700 [Salix dunnii]
MGSQNPNQNSSLYPQIIRSKPDHLFTSSSSSPPSNLYPKIDPEDLVENLFPGYDQSQHEYPSAQSHTHPPPSAPPEVVEEVLLKIAGAIVNLIDKDYSVELASGDLYIIRLCQGNNVVAVLVRVDDEIQWPLAKDEAAVKLDDSHYFFSLRLPSENCSSDSSDEENHKREKRGDGENILSYGLTIASKGQERLLSEFDQILGSYSCFSSHKVSESAKELLDGNAAKEISPMDMKLGGEKKKIMEGKCAAYWTTLAPNVEDYSGTAGKLIAAGSGQLIKGILWCGDVTMDRLKWGNEVMKKRMDPKQKSEISPDTLKRIKRVKRMTKMTEKVANGLLCGVLKVSGFFTSSVANSKVGKKFFGLLPGEIVLASLDGFTLLLNVGMLVNFDSKKKGNNIPNLLHREHYTDVKVAPHSINKVCDALEVAGRNVMSTSSTVTTELVSHRYGEEAAKATNEGLGAAGHAIGTAWAAFKIRKAFNPKSVLKPSSLAKSAAKAAAAEKKAKKSK